ncbi:MAG: glycosyltransferase family 4 protein [bacterium]|nr:glycosyltransferase family 4 protein [bacterium]
MSPDKSTMKLLGIDYGDPYDISTFSGSSYHIWTTLKNKVDLVQAITPYPARAITTLFKLAAFRPSAQKWRANWRRSIRFKNYISKKAAAIVSEKYAGKIDATLQIGAYYDISGAFDGVKGLLADNNCAITQRTNINFQSSDAVYQRQFQFEKRVYNSMDRVFCFSSFLADSMVEDFSVPREKVKVVHAGINTDEKLLNCPDKDYNRQTVLFSGYDFVNKGGMVLLEAFARVRKALPKAKLILLGPTLASVPEGVLNHGPLSKNNPDQLAKIVESYRQATLLVLPTFADAYPNVVREAMAAKLPTIASRTGSIPEMITDNETGFLVPMRDVDTLAAKMIELLSDPDRCRTMGETAYREYRSKFRWDTVCDRMIGELEPLVNKHD